MGVIKLAFFRKCVQCFIQPLKFSCSICEILFDSSMLLEHHKDAYDHWSDADISESDDEDEVYGGDCYYTDCDGNRS